MFFYKTGSRFFAGACFAVPQDENVKQFLGGRGKFEKFTIAIEGVMMYAINKRRVLSGAAACAIG